MTEDLGLLPERAAATRVAVIGGGIGGLVAAREFAKVGMSVTLFEADDRLGGAVRSGEVAGLALDLGAESYATRGGHVRALIDDLGIADLVVEPGTGAGGAWVAGLPGGGAAPLPVGGILGIPANPFAVDVRRVIGWSGAWRAYLDRVRPVLTIGRDRSLGHLVRTRLGRTVLDRLVAPVTNGVYSADPDDIDTDVAAPGLNGALTKTGSLLGAVDLLLHERAQKAGAPGSAVEGLRGGMGRLIEALAAALADAGVRIRTASPVTELAREEDGWRIVTPAAAESAHPEPAAAEPAEPAAPAPEPAAPEAPERFDLVLVATEEHAARRLIAPHAAGLAPEPPRPGPVVHVATLVLDAPELDAAPRGTGVLTVPGSFTAKALTHATAKWGWVRDAAGPGRHVVRVSFGAQGSEPATRGLSDDAAAERALDQAGRLLGVPLRREQLRGFALARFTQSQPAATIGRRDDARAARDAIRGVTGLGAAGAWLAGTGLAQVVPDAIAEADRLRRVALWADEPDAND
ncbi:protoporphyrinogen/coproporphyrinogen oxidase [Microbacterium sediminis]|uniref:Protoporphyrinogen oxidase n=1 Tax=Microbacterium sediminis TaxID=904291 RepID=A0A1B9N9J0_9MICO|nr:FAD-dependent oxidoreductase [Microbacterium sediminis]OCG73265.1 protoporphyrinogen oxidase [Microbacterium sediminis]